MGKIKASVGILTYNSEKNLARALASVADFEDIIIADGGSTDRTVSIAEQFGARVMSQSNPGHPIIDFAKERNRLLDAARESWFIYLDSDEIMSPALAEAVRKISDDAHHSYGAYRVRYQKTNADGTHPYRTYREYYQVRLTRTDTGACFARAIHEVLLVPKGIAVGQLEAPWYVPLEPEDLMFGPFARKAWKRTAGTLSAWEPKGVGNVLTKVVIGPTTLIGKSLWKAFMVKIRYGKDAIPLSYELLRVVYALMLSIQAIRRVLAVGIWSRRTKGG